MNSVDGSASMLAVLMSSIVVTVLLGTVAHAETGGGPSASVVVGPRAPALEAFAAQELCGYLDRLFGLRVQPATSVPERADLVFLVGSPATNPAVRRAVARRPFPHLSDQGFVLRNLQLRQRPALLVGGGSPVATLWAVYDLAERWGVQPLLHGDVLPERRPAGPLPVALGSAGEAISEPLLPVRQWRVVNDFALGPESWGMADYRPVIDQLAKLRFNRLFVNLWPYQPFLDLEVRGIRRRQAYLWYDYHYPITDDMAGRELFGDLEEFWNPDLPRHASYEEFSAAGQRHIHALMAYGRQRGMGLVLNATLTEFPPEFAPLLPGAQKVQQLGEMGIVPGPESRLDDPAVTELATAVLQATVNTYPEVDFISLGMPEFRQWAGQYERAWRELDAKYRIEEVLPLREVIARAEHRPGYPGGAERAVQEAKGDIVALRFYDRLLTDLAVLKGTKRPDMRFILNSVAEELFPILARVAPPGSEALNFVDYTPSGIVARRQVLQQAPSHDLPCTLIYTLHDDNVGVLPQLTTGSLHELTRDLIRCGWAGFSTRYWLIGDHDPCVAYLARAAWQADTTPERVYRDQVMAVCGEACVEDMLTVFGEVEATTVRLEQHGLGLTFPIPGMMMKHWTPEPMPPELVEDRRSYQRALDAARRALTQASPGGRTYIEYWIGRLEFGIGYLDTIEAVHRAATAEAGKQPQEAQREAATAVVTARRALEAYARVARDQSDRGAIAVMNEYVYRPLQAKAAELERQGAR